MISTIFKNLAKQQSNIISRSLIQNKNIFTFCAQNNVNVEQIIRDILSNNPKTESKEVKLQDKFSDLGFDSLEKVELITEVEESLDVSLDDDVSGKIITVEDAVKAFIEVSKQ